MKFAKKLSSQLSVFGSAICCAVLSSVVIAQTGDFNQDGAFDCTDIDALGAEIVAGTNNLLFDLDGNSLVNSDDRYEWLVEAGAANLPSGNPYLGADANLDGFVDISDFNAWNEQKFTFNSSFCSGDFNSDGTIDGSDFMLWNLNKFTNSDVAQPARPAAGSLDETVTFTYDPESGLLSMDTGDIGVNCFTVTGPTPFETMDLGSGSVDENGSQWLFSAFNEDLKWMSLETSDASGYFELAMLEPGLTADDFGQIGFMNQALETGTTTIQIVQPNTVPEPGGLMLITISTAAMLLSRRRR